MKALVTGASGFVGSTLCQELLRRGIEPLALMRKTSSSAKLGGAQLRTVEGDLRDPASLARAVEEVDLVFHVGGVVAARSREDFHAANAAGTSHLLEAVKRRARPLRRFVYVSSLAAAGPSRPDRPNEEADDCQPLSDYGWSKREGELATLGFRDAFPVTIVRPPAVYGPRDSGSGLFTFFQAVSKGVLPLLGLGSDGGRRYSFVHIDDLVQGIVLAGLAEHVRSGEIFYLSGEGEFSWEETMRLIARGMNRRTLTVHLPIAVMKAAAVGSMAYGRLSGQVMPLSLDKMKEIEAPSWTCSNRKAKAELQFAPYWDLERGLAHTARWYRENGVI